MQSSILVPTDRGMQVIDVHSIIRVQSISNYSKLFFQNGKTLVVAKVLRWFEERLQTHKFIRIHRTHLVNSGCLKAYNGPEIELTNGERFTVARRKRNEFFQTVRLLCSFLLFSAIFFQANAQSVGVGTTTPDASAVLDVSGTTGGLLIPRLTATERDAINNPAKGLLVFCSTDSSMYCYDGAWKRMAPVAHVWNLEGNSGTSPGTHFIGTKDAVPLAFAVNNMPRMFLYSNGRLHLNGDNYNTLVGANAGFSITTGSYNTFLGTSTGHNNTVGYMNTIIGMETGWSNTSGNYNVIVGAQAGFRNRAGEANTYLGTHAGRNNQNGHHNVMAGTSAGFYNEGSYNTFVGWAAGLAAGGDRLHFVGYEAGKNNAGANNHFTGYQAGTMNTTGIDNHFEGYRAGANNTTGLVNHFSGHDAGYNNVDGFSNTFVGYNTGYSNIAGIENTYIGSRTGFSANANRNVFIGWNAGSATTMGDNNTIIGHQSGRNNLTGGDNTFIGISSGFSNTTGSGNYFGGFNAGFMNTTGSNNTLIGKDADVTAGNLTNAGAIGYNAKVAQSNSFVIGGTGADAVRVGIGISSPITTLHVNGVVAGIGPYLNLSDSRVKKNILPVTNAIAGILQLQPVSYDWKKDAYPQFNFDDKRQIGFLAQELQKIFPEAVTLGSDGFYTISYSTLIPVVVQGMKEQQQ